MDREIYICIPCLMLGSSEVATLQMVEAKELPGYYKTMDVLAMPSHWEGFGLTAADAMAAGVPVAGSDVPGLREVIADTVTLFPVNNEIALADAIRTILAHRVKYSGMPLHSCSNEFFSFSTASPMAGRVSEIIEFDQYLKRRYVLFYDYH